MRLRLTIRRHGLPDTPVVWVVDTSSSPSPTISQLLESVNEAIPIESEGDWGLEDYAVELKGASGANYECLHFQHVAAVMKEDDEVIIRPLLTQDLKIRRVSGRRQISAEGKHLFDGLAFGRPLLRRPADRPPITIPPRKRRRVTYDDEEQDAEEIPTITMTEAEDPDSDANKQLILHADFDDEDSEDDEDFVPGGDHDADDDENIDDEFDDDVNEDSAEDLDQSNSSGDDQEMVDEQAADNIEQNQDTHLMANNFELPIENEPAQVPSGASESNDTDESVLADEPEPRRVKIRELHAVFPKSPMAVCKYILSGTDGDMGEAYEAMARGFRPVKSKTSFTKRLEGNPDLLIPRTRSKAKLLPVADASNQHSIEQDRDDSPNSLVRHYDQGGLPPGSIKSGKALSFMAEALHSSPARPQSQARRSTSAARRSASVVSNKSVIFATDEALSTGLTSTPFIDQESQMVESSEESESDSDNDDSSEADATSSDDSNDSDDSDSDASSKSSHAKESDVHNASSSGDDSSSDSSSDSLSEDELPEETSSKLLPTASRLEAAGPAAPSARNLKQTPSAPPGQGSKSTRKRNERKRRSNALDRYTQKGILPAGTTLSELSRLHINDDTPPEVAFAALEELRAGKNTDHTTTKDSSQSQSQDFELRRQQLLDSLASGGIEVSEILGAAPPTRTPDKSPSAPAKATIVTQFANPSSSLTPATTELPPFAKAPESEEMDLDVARPSTAPEAPEIDTPLASPKPQPATTEPGQPAARRSKIDLGAGRRLLFGALGIKAPRTKKDEEKVRADLMKDVRPLVPPKLSEPVEPATEEAVEDSEAWREKIVYRAVECVQEGINLSEPPFPFIQRWDPQQQSAWSQNGKRKQAGREQSQHYQGNVQPSKKQKRRKGKHSYAEEQEFLNASYEPSFQEENIELNYDDSTQLTRPEDEDIEGEITMQLLNDIEGPNGDVSQAPDDCVPLPDDPSSLPDLQDGEAKTGMTIAFKMLDLSAATQWNPVVSPYRTAIVIAVLDDGTLQLTLAMRDRVTTEKRYDEETGERIYQKFEMAGGDDMEEDDGLLNLSFGELIQPKILQEPPQGYEDDDLVMDEVQQKEAISFDESTTLSQQPAEAPLSHVTETPLDSDASKPYHVEQSIQQSIEILLARSPSPTAVIQVASIVENEVVEHPMTAITTPAVTESHDISTFISSVEQVDNTAEPEGDNNLQPKRHVSAEPVSEDARQQIAHLMQDADFRPEIPSSVRETQPESMQSPGEAAALEKLLTDMTETNEKAYSPKFNGLGSSPIKKLRGSSRTPSESRIRVVDSSPTRQPKQPSLDPGQERQVTISLGKPPQSSWETVDPSFQSSSPPPPQHADSSWVTEDSHAQPSSPPFVQPVKTAPKIKPLTRKAPIGKAQALWEQLQPRKPSTDSDNESTSNSANRALGLDGVDDRDEKSASVQYPKLSMGSSFTSQVEDHGRQPDFDFDDSVISHGSPRGVVFDADITINASPELAPDRQPTTSVMENEPIDSESDFEVPAPKADKGKSVMSAFDPDASASEDDPFPPQKTTLRAKVSKGSFFDEGSAKLVDKKLVKKAAPSTALEPTSSDSDFFPSLEALSQQSATIKREKSMIPPKTTKTETHRSISGISSRAADLSEDEDQITPKASQKQRAPSQGQASKTKLPEKPSSSQSRVSVPRASHPLPSQGSVIPPGSQVIDMTLDSSDVESEPQAEVTVSSDLDIRPTKFKKFSVTDDDEDYEDESGWVPKKTSTLGGVEARRKTSGSLRASSQTSLNTKNRRKTNA